ncbi:unnamed protein product [Urochloa humidicola]
MEPAEATRKKARPRRRRGGGGGPDLLSALPDCLLHVIMSLLKARQVVQTCVLSTRWRDLWRSVPCLDIDFDEFRAETSAPSGSGGEDGPEADDICGPAAECSDSDHSIGSGGGVDSFSSSNDSSDSEDSSSGPDVNSSDSENNDSSDSDLDSSDWSSSSSSSSSSSDDDDDDANKGKELEWEKFEDFTANLMLCCNIAQLDSFRLHTGRCTVPLSSYRKIKAAGWLRRAMKYCAPDPPGQCKGLISDSWCLRRLHLGHVCLDDRFAKHISLVCLSLEDLELHNCSCQIQSVTSSSLKNLVLRNCTWHNLSEITSPSLKTLVIDGGLNISECVLAILTPAVAYLHLAVNVFNFQSGISTNEMPSLVKTSIDLQDHRDYFLSQDNKLGGDQFKLLCSVSNVASLELSSVGTMVLGKEPTFQEFTNLRNLLLGNCDLRKNFRTLGFFLQSSPNLEKLTLRHCKFPHYPKKKKGKPKLIETSEFRGPDFMCENLKVEIIYKDADARKLVKLLLHAAGNLSKHNIKLTKVN